MSPLDILPHETRELWGRIDSPVMLVSGSESWMDSVEREKHVTYFKDATHVTVQDAGHWVQHDQLDEFLGLTRDFFG